MDFKSGDVEMVINMSARIRKEERGRLIDPVIRHEWFRPLEGGGSPDNCAVLLIHGFGGTPQDLRPIFEMVQAQDRSVRGFVLPGHCGRSVREMKDVGREDYREEALKHLNHLAQHHPAGVDVVGFSVGGVIAMDIANEPRVRSVTLINPFTTVPMKWYYGLTPRRWSNILGSVAPYVPKFGKGDILDPKGYERYEPSYNSTSVVAYKRIQDYATDVWETVDKIHIPVCFAYSPQDSVSDPAKMSKEARRICSKPYDRTVVCKYSGHIITYDYDCESLLQQIELFWRSIN